MASFAPNLLNQVLQTFRCHLICVILKNPKLPQLAQSVHIGLLPCFKRLWKLFFVSFLCMTAKHAKFAQINQLRPRLQLSPIGVPRHRQIALNLLLLTTLAVWWLGIPFVVNENCFRLSPNFLGWALSVIELGRYLVIHLLVELGACTPYRLGVFLG